MVGLRVYGVDQEICLHCEDKLRIMLGGLLGQLLPATVLGVRRRCDQDWTARWVLRSLST
jgi:hypothetical protein